MKYTVDELDYTVDQIIKKSGSEPILSFSMGEFEDDDDKEYEDLIVDAPDFSSNFAEGKVIFYADDYFNKYKSKVINNPNWSDVLIHANKAAKNDHIFLESIDLKEEKNGIKYYQFFFGS